VDLKLGREAPFLCQRPSHAFDRSASLLTVLDMLGHSAVAVTDKYFHSKRKDSTALHLAI